MIQFFNYMLGHVRNSRGRRSRFTLYDVFAADEQYSSYLRHEFDDEICAHWSGWEGALRTISAMGIRWFTHKDFATEFARRQRLDDTTPDKALEMLYDFSIIGYQMHHHVGDEVPINFAYRSPDVGWDPAAEVFAVHPGLTSSMRLAESKETEWIGFDW